MSASTILSRQHLSGPMIYWPYVFKIFQFLLWRRSPHKSNPRILRGRPHGYEKSTCANNMVPHVALPHLRLYVPCIHYLEWSWFNTLTASDIQRTFSTKHTKLSWFGRLNKVSNLAKDSCFPCKWPFGNICVEDGVCSSNVPFAAQDGCLHQPYSRRRQQLYVNMKSRRKYSILQGYCLVY